MTDGSWLRGHATFAASYGDCGLDGGRGCFWSASAYVMHAEQSCRGNDPFNRPPPSFLAWASGDQSANATVMGEVDFPMLGAPSAKLCLYVYDRVTKSYWVGASEFTVGTLPPPPAAMPSAAGTPVAPALTASVAKTAAARALLARYPREWRAKKGRVVSCGKPVRGTVRCRVRFRSGKLLYSGTVVVSGDGAHAKTKISVRRRRA